MENNNYELLHDYFCGIDIGEDNISTLISTNTRGYIKLEDVQEAFKHFEEMDYDYFFIKNWFKNLFLSKNRLAYFDLPKSDEYLDLKAKYDIRDDDYAPMQTLIACLNNVLRFFEDDKPDNENYKIIARHIGKDIANIDTSMIKKMKVFLENWNEKDLIKYASDDVKNLYLKVLDRLCYKIHDPYAMAVKAEHMYSGLFFERNDDEIIDLFEKSQIDDKQVARIMGDLYRLRGDKDKSIEWYTRGAEHNDPYCIYQLINYGVECDADIEHLYKTQCLMVGNAILDNDWYYLDKLVNKKSDVSFTRRYMSASVNKMILDARKFNDTKDVNEEDIVAEYDKCKNSGNVIDQTELLVACLNQIRDKYAHSWIKTTETVAGKFRATVINTYGDKIDGEVSDHARGILHFVDGNDLVSYISNTFEFDFETDKVLKSFNKGLKYDSARLEGDAVVLTNKKKIIRIPMHNVELVPKKFTGEHYYWYSLGSIDDRLIASTYSREYIKPGTVVECNMGKYTRMYVIKAVNKFNDIYTSHVDFERNKIIRIVGRVDE